MALWLAWRDFVHEARVFACFVVALAALLAPLLILFGLKFGVIDTLRGRLLEDPRNRELTLAASARLSPEWFTRLRARPEVAFLLPRTRAIAATIELTAPEAAERHVVRVELIPSEEGDPLLADRAPAPRRRNEVVLSAAAAGRLGIAAGTVIQGNVVREVDDRLQRVTLPLEVIGVAPSSVVQRPAAFVAIELMSAVEDYRDGFAVPALGWPGDDPGVIQRLFPGFRLFARTLDDVATLEQELVAQNLEIRSEAAAIETVRHLDRNLGRVFAIVAGIGVAGYLLSLAASLWANVERKRRDLSVVRLLGFQIHTVIAFPVCQAVYTALLGMVLAAVAFFAAAWSINNLFRDSLEAGETACRLLPWHWAAAAAATLACTVLASSLAGYQASRIDPSEGVRDV